MSISDRHAACFGAQIPCEPSASLPFEADMEPELAIVVAEARRGFSRRIEILIQGDESCLFIPKLWLMLRYGVPIQKVYTMECPDSVYVDVSPMAREGCFEMIRQDCDMPPWCYAKQY